MSDRVDARYAESMSSRVEMTAAVQEAYTDTAYGEVFAQRAPQSQTDATAMDFSTTDIYATQANINVQDGPSAGEKNPEDDDYDYGSDTGDHPNQDSNLPSNEPPEAPPKNDDYINGDSGGFYVPTDLY